MKIYQEVPLPPTCYIDEGAFWLAVGRVPRVLVKASDYGNDYSETDPRTNREALDEDASIIPYDSGFSEEELRSMGVSDIDFHLYMRTKELLTTGFPYLRRPSGDQVVAAELQQQEIWDTIAPEHERPRLSEEALNAIRDGVNWANEVDARCDAVIDSARAEIYQALAAGQITAQGWREEPAIGLSSDDVLVAIPANHWSLRKFDWEESTLRHLSGDYYGVQMPTAELLSKFPRPISAPQSQLVERYASCILIDEDATPRRSAPAKTGRGRPAKGDGLIKLAVVNVFTARARKGDLPEKAEALCQEIIDYVSMAFEETISRSTAQQYSKLLPENRAGK